MPLALLHELGGTRMRAREGAPLALLQRSDRLSGGTAGRAAHGVGVPRAAGATAAAALAG